jgi:hypothetical protein
MPKLHHVSEDHYAFHCPGCGHAHMIPLAGEKAWTWNGSLDSPTIFPSIKTWKNYPAGVCHSFVGNGRIQFLNDCEHPLRGQTVEIPEWFDGSLWNTMRMKERTRSNLGSVLNDK